MNELWLGTKRLWFYVRTPRVRSERFFCACSCGYYDQYDVGTSYIRCYVHKGNSTYRRSQACQNDYYSDIFATYIITIFEANARSHRQESVVSELSNRTASLVHGVFGCFDAIITWKMWLDSLGRKMMRKTLDVKLMGRKINADSRSRGRTLEKSSVSFSPVFAIC